VVRRRERSDVEVELGIAPAEAYDLAAHAAAAAEARRKKTPQAAEGLAGTQLDVAKCPACRQTLVARYTRKGVGFPCGCPGRGDG
jgi:hypothetical protein